MQKKRLCSNVEGRPRSLEELAAEIFGVEDRDSAGRWVEYWKSSLKRNQDLLEAFRRLALIDFDGKAVLDIGCGTGGLGELIGDRCRHYVGADYHGHVLQFARGPANCSYLQCSGHELPFPDQSFDYIFAFDVIEHLVGGWPWQVRFLKELRRVLRPLGMAFITTPNWWYPKDGHTGLYFPQYLPSFLADRYIGWLNPGFLNEHSTFREIKLLRPGQLRRALDASGLTFLHSLPCGLDRRELLDLSRLRGLLSALGLGWYFHAEFWGILVRRESRSWLQLKLRKNWIYETNQPSARLRDFGRRIDFSEGSYGYQLGPGWHWFEEDSPGYRWTRNEAVCYMQSRQPVQWVRIHGYSPWENGIGIVVDGTLVTRVEVKPKSGFTLQVPIPSAQKADRIFEVKIGCREVHSPENPDDRRELGLMIFWIELE